MIKLTVREARTFYEGPDSELDVMYECLRVKDKHSYWRARFILKKLGLLSVPKEADPDPERVAKYEKIVTAAQWIKFYNKRNDSFATGLLKTVKKWLDEKDILYKVINKRRPKLEFDESDVKFNFKSKVEERQEQLAVLRLALNKGCGILHCAPNFGKTEVACAIIAAWFKKTGKMPRTIFIIHRRGLAEQTKKRFEKHLGVKVAMIGGGKKKKLRRITVTTTQTGSRLIKKKSATFKDFLSKCDIMFLDELHVNKANQATKVADNCRARMRFGLSGTIDKANSTKMMHFTGLTGPIIAEVRNKELVERGRSAKPLIKMVEIDTAIVVGENFPDSYRRAIVKNRFRNERVCREALNYVKKNYRTLITVARIRHGKILQEMLEGMVDIPVEFIKGSTPSSVRWKVKKKFANHKIPILIASPIFDVGEDLPEIDAWVNAAGGKGWELVLQRLGRTMRKKSGENVVRITDFVDKHNKYMMKHSIKRLQHYTGENVGVVRIVE